MILRSKIPTRRLHPTRNPTGTNWREHKADLKQDFNRHCAYCDTFDGFRDSFFEVDHFIPVKFLKKHGTISLTAYSNLVYSCRHCNNAKRAQWPSGSEVVSHNNKEGFIDPCSVELDDHLYRTEDGAIMWKKTSLLGKWMWQKGFKFDERQNAIKLLYNLDKTRILIDKLRAAIETMDKKSTEYKKAKLYIGEVAITYCQYHFELMDFNN